MKHPPSRNAFDRREGRRLKDYDYAQKRAEEIFAGIDNEDDLKAAVAAARDNPILAILLAFLGFENGMASEGYAQGVSERYSSYPTTAAILENAGVRTDVSPSATRGTDPTYNNPTPSGGMDYGWLAGLQKSSTYPIPEAVISDNPNEYRGRVITSAFGTRDLKSSPNHKALDLRARYDSETRKGADIVSIFSGKIIGVGDMSVKVLCDEDGPNKGLVVEYLHVDGKLEPGTRVEEGQKIAEILPKCNINPYEPHLDIRAYHESSGKYLNPALFMTLDGVIEAPGITRKDNNHFYNPRTRKFETERQPAELEIINAKLQEKTPVTSTQTEVETATDTPAPTATGNEQASNKPAIPQETLTSLASVQLKETNQLMPPNTSVTSSHVRSV